jgi:hypothetical protein
MRKSAMDCAHLFERDAPALPNQSPCRIEAEHGEIRVREKRIFHAGRCNKAVEFSEWLEEALMNRVEWHIMIARHHDQRSADAVEEVTRFGKFGAACALREIAADDDEIGAMVIQAMKKGGDLARIVAAEMEI